MHLFYEADGSGQIDVAGVSKDVNFYKLHYGFFPKVVLWNPYNVDMLLDEYNFNALFVAKVT